MAKCLSGYGFELACYATLQKIVGTSQCRVLECSRVLQMQLVLNFEASSKRLKISLCFLYYVGRANHTVCDIINPVLTAFVHEFPSLHNTCTLNRRCGGMLDRSACVSGTAGRREAPSGIITRGSKKTQNQAGGTDCSGT